MNRSDIDELLTLQETADVLRVSYKTVLRNTWNETWPCVHIGRAVRIRASVVAAIASGELEHRNGDCEAGE
jgi:excisionase family DNA binding protein